jgi:ABC-2 type transport system permease protein
VTATPATPTAATREPGTTGVRARPSSFVHDLTTIAGRALRAAPREPEAIVPALVIPLFFFVVNTGALQDVAERGGVVSDFKAFQLPVAILFAVTGVSRAPALVTDIQNGYFDRLLLTPVRRLALLLGLMVADFALVITLAVPVIVLGFLVGVSFATGLLGILAFLVLAGCWGVAFNGFAYAIALKTGNPAAVNSSFILFFPFLFLTTSFLPQEALTGWLATVADFNPVTYLLAGMRAIVMEGWEAGPIAQAISAILGVGAVSVVLSLLALRGRTRRT